jgi:two-component sensor histidine kinase/HAMP domain-containing protein
VAISANTLTSGYVFAREYSNALQSKALVIGQSLKLELDRLLKLEIALNDIVGFESQCQDIVNSYEEITYAMVVDTEGLILFHNSPSQHGITLTDPAIVSAIQRAEETIQIHMLQGEDYYDITIPVFGTYGEHIGAIRIGFPVSMINMNIANMVSYSVIVASISLGLGTVLLILTLSIWVVKPLMKLVVAIQEIRQKGASLARQVDINSNDEIGQLASAFNRMMSELKESQNQIRSYTHELELKVEERTGELKAINNQLQHDITERKKAEAQIEASLKEKEVLLQEIHHRVKNNLQVISSLLNLQSEYVEDQKALEVFQESQHRVRSMALIHEKLYRSENLAQIDFADYVRELSTYLFRSQTAKVQDITLTVQPENIFLDIDRAVPCGLMLNELVSNALKHAFPNGRPGEIRIELSIDNHRQLTLKVIDNGIGFLAEWDYQNTKSLGLQLVNTLVDQLDGKIELDRDNGMEFTITFAAPHRFKE